MADQAITALPKKTYSGSSKIAATDYLLGIDSAEGYQMLIQDLGEYIINRVTASLAGSNQTLAAAISALNSKSFIDLQEINGDIDNQSTYPTGNFLTHFAIAKTEASGTKPLTDGFLVTFIYRNNPSTPTSSYMTQVFIEDNQPIVYIRGFNKGTWSNWKLLQSS